MGLAALSSQPELRRKVASAVLLAPVSFVTHITSTVFWLQAWMRIDKVCVPQRGSRLCWMRIDRVCFSWGSTAWLCVSGDVARALA